MMPSVLVESIVRVLERYEPQSGLDVQMADIVQVHGPTKSSMLVAVPSAGEQFIITVEKVAP